jgi:hypothetical protein
MWHCSNCPTQIFLRLSGRSFEYVRQKVIGATLEKKAPIMFSNFKLKEVIEMKYVCGILTAFTI